MQLVLYCWAVVYYNFPPRPAPPTAPIPHLPHTPIYSPPQDLEEYNPADMVQSLCRMISYNIGQLAYLNAKR